MLAAGMDHTPRLPSGCGLNTEEKVPMTECVAQPEEKFN